MGKDYRSRKGSDIVYTPYSMTEQLLEKEDFLFSDSVLEPCAGNGAIYKVLNKKFKYQINAYDLSSDYFPKKDFLKYYFTSYIYTITNPPYSLWDKFIEQARFCTKKKFAFLGQLNFLNGISRFENNLYYNGSYNLKKVYVFTRQANLKFFDREKELEKFKNECHIYNDLSDLEKARDKIKKQINYPKIREDGKYPAGAVVYAWYVFENGYTGKAEIDWINNQKYILKTDRSKKL